MQNMNVGCRLVLLNMYEGAKLGGILSDSDAGNYTESGLTPIGNKTFLYRQALEVTR